MPNRTRDARAASPRISRVALLASVLALNAAPARSQNHSLPAEFDTLYADLARPDVVISAEQGRAALAQLQKLGLNASALPADARLKLLRAEVLAQLGTGDARSALARAAELLADAPTAPDALQSAWLAAVAAGDAEQVNDLGKRLAGSAAAETKRTLSKRRRQLKAVARPPLPAKYTNSEERVVSFADRDQTVLVLDVWSLRDKPARPLIDALNGLRADHAGQSNIDLLSINVDAADKREAAQKFLTDNACTWPTAFAAAGAGDADLVDALDAGLPTYQAVIDQHGFVRAVGDLREPALRYAIRAAHAEARGEFPPVLPKTLDGRTARPRASADAADSDDSGGRGAGAAPPAAKPSNPEAAELLKQVRLYRRTGRYTDAKALCREIIEKYAGTVEAEEAEFFLRSMP